MHNADEERRHSIKVSASAGKYITIAWFIYMVCKHPVVQSKIAKEVKEPTVCLFFIISSLRPTCAMCVVPE